MTAAELVADAVSVHLGRSVLLDGVTLRLAAGELLAVVGPNGAGKSTLVSVLAGDRAPTAGEVRLRGRPLPSYRPRELARLRAVLPQQSVLQFAYTAREVVGLGRAPWPGSAAGDAAVAAALADTDAAGLAGRTFPTLSGGEQGRVTLARVLAQQTPVVLLDEPTAALDLRHQQLVLRLARRLAAGGRAVLAVWHDLGLAARADRVAVLDRGRLVAAGPPEAVLTAELLGAVYRHPVRVVPHPLDGSPLVLPAHNGEAR
jgi:iron complex transport system ATP-binding protein